MPRVGVLPRYNPRKLCAALFAWALTHTESGTMPALLAPSNMFPIDPSLSAMGESESAGSYVAHDMGKNRPQPYRGSSRPSTAEHPASSMRLEVQALTARVSMLQQQLADASPADELQQLQQLCGKLAALDKVPLRHCATAAPATHRARRAAS